MSFLKSNKLLYFWIIFYILNANVRLAAQNELQIQTQLLKEDMCLERGSLSVLVRDLESLETISELNSTSLRIPASTLKIVTTSSALEILGSDFKFKTIFQLSGKQDGDVFLGDLVIRAGGDPTFLSGSEGYGELKSIVRNLKEKFRTLGIQCFQGGIMIDASGFDRQPVPDGWVYQDLGNYYAAGAYPINCFGNEFKMTFVRSKEGTNPTIQEVIPEIGVLVDNKVISEGEGDHAFIYPTSDPDLLLVKGTIPPGTGKFQIKGAIPNPPLFFAGLLSELLEEEGISFFDDPVIGYYGMDSEISLKTILEIISSPLSEIIQEINFHSRNMYSEALLLAISRETSGEGSYQNGIQEILDFWSPISNEIESIILLDGSGLSPQNRLTAEFLLDVLVYMMKDSKHREVFRHSLPRNGIDGNVAHIFKSGTYNSCMRLKSGSMSGQLAYAGITIPEEKDPLAFVIFANDYQCTPYQMRKAIAEYFRGLCSY